MFFAENSSEGDKSDKCSENIDGKHKDFIRGVDGTADKTENCGEVQEEVAVVEGDGIAVISDPHGFHIDGELPVPQFIGETFDAQKMIGEVMPRFDSGQHVG